MNSSAWRPLAAALSLLGTVAAAQSHTAITRATLIDVKAGRAVPNQTVLIKDDRIDGVVTAEAIAQLGQSTRVIDGSKLFIIPGLFDAHVHYVDHENFGKLFIAHGVTFVRDMGGPTESILSTRDKLNKGELLGPEMICTGAIIDGNPPVWPFSEACDTPEEARAAVQKLKAAGVNQIKVYSKLKPDVYRAAVEEARKVGLKAVGHIPLSISPDEAAAAGQSSVEHLSQIDRLVAELVPDAEADKSLRGGMWAGFNAWDRMPKVDPAALDARLKPFAAAGMFQCPTLVVMAGIGRLSEPDADKDPRLAYVPTEFRSFWGGDQYKGFSRWAGQAVPHMQSMVRAMDKAGVPLMIGTDLANPYVFAGLSVHEEMQLFAKAGVEAASVLRSATIIPAEFMGVADRYGTIEKGKVASFVLLSANPLDDISNTLKIEGVFVRGKYYDRIALDNLLKDVRLQVVASLPKTSAIKLELPGEPIARGTYTAKFGKFDAGTEEFLITRAADGFRLIANNQPKGGFQKPTLVTMHYGPDWSFISATFKPLVESPTEATYTRIGKQIEARATKDGKPLPVQTVDAPDTFSLGSPIYAGEFMSLQAAKLEVGKTLEASAIGFGYPDWKLTTTTITITREPDTEVQRAGGKAKARFFKSVLNTPMGAFNGKTWTDERGVVLKSEVVMPFGTVTAELK